MIQAAKIQNDLDIIIIKRIARDRVQAVDLPVPKIQLIKIEYQGPDATVPAARDGIQIVFINGDRIIERPSGTEPVGKGYVDAKNPLNAGTFWAVVMPTN